LESAQYLHYKSIFEQSSCVSNKCNTVTRHSFHLVLEFRHVAVRWCLNLLLWLLTGRQSPRNHQCILQKLTLLQTVQQLYMMITAVKLSDFVSLADYSAASHIKLVLQRVFRKENLREWSEIFLKIECPSCHQQLTATEELNTSDGTNLQLTSTDVLDMRVYNKILVKVQCLHSCTVSGLGFPLVAKITSQFKWIITVTIPLLILVWIYSARSSRGLLDGVERMTFQLLSISQLASWLTLVH